MPGSAGRGRAGGCCLPAPRAAGRGRVWQRRLVSGGHKGKPLCVFGRVCHMACSLRFLLGQAGQAGGCHALVHPAVACLADALPSSAWLMHCRLLPRRCTALFLPAHAHTGAGAGGCSVPPQHGAVRLAQGPAAGGHSGGLCWRLLGGAFGALRRWQLRPAGSARRRLHVEVVMPQLPSSWC